MRIQKHPLERGNPLPEDIRPPLRACIRREQSRPGRHSQGRAWGPTAQPRTKWAPCLGWTSHQVQATLGVWELPQAPVHIHPLGFAHQTALRAMQGLLRERRDETPNVGSISSHPYLPKNIGSIMSQGRGLNLPPRWVI